MSRANSMERDRKPLPPVPNTNSLAESSHTTATDKIVQTLKKLSQDLPTTEYRSPLNLAGRIKNELSEMSREIPVARSASHDYRAPKDKSKQPPLAEIPPDHHQAPGEGDTITSAEKIRRNWEESQKTPARQPSSHHHKSSSRSSRDAPRYRGTTSPPTAFRSGDGFPWEGHSRPHRQDSTQSRHRRERSAGDEPRDVEIYDNSDNSEPPSPVLEIHNATPLYERDGMKSRGRPGLTSRFRSSLQRIGVGSTRPVKQRADISRSPSSERRSRSPSPHTWRKPSPHSSVRATEQYGTPQATGFSDTLPRIESQRMDLDWSQPLDSDVQAPPRPPDDVIPTIPDLNTPGIYHEYGPRSIPILDGDKLRPVELHDHGPTHRVERSEATTATAVNPPSQRSYYQEETPVVRNVDESPDIYEGRDIVPGRLKRLLSLNGRTVPIDGPDAPPNASPPAVRPKVYSASSGIIRSASLIRTRSRRKESSKTQERRVEPDVVQVDYESDGWGESPPVVRDAQGNIIPPAPKRRGSLKNKSTGPTKIALPLGQVEEFHSVHSNSPVEAGPKDLVSDVPMMRSENKRTTSSSTFHTAQSETTRPSSPTRKLPNQPPRQVKASVPETRTEGWRRSRAGAPRRPSQTLLAPTSTTAGNQYADEEITMPEPQLVVVFPEHQHHHHHDHHHDHRQDVSDVGGYFPPQSLPVMTHRSQSPAPHEHSVHILPAQCPPAPAPPPHDARPHSPPTHELRPYSPSAYDPRARSPPPLLDPRARSPPPLLDPRVPTPPLLDPRAHTPILHGPRTHTPPLQDPRAHSLAAHDMRAHSPPVHDMRAHSPPVHDLRAHSPPIHDLRAHSPAAHDLRTHTPPPHNSPHISPDQSPGIQTPRAQSPPLEDRHVQILPAENPPAEHTYDDSRYHPHVDTRVEPDMRSIVLDTPTYVLPRMPTPTLTSPGVLVNPPSISSPTIDRTRSPGPRTPPRSVHIEYGDDVRDPVSGDRPIPRSVAMLSGSDQQQRQQNRQTGSEMSFVAVEPLTKREKLAASVLNISSMPWLRARMSTSRSHPYTESSYHSTHEEDDSRYRDRYDRHDRHDRQRQPIDYLGSPSAPQLPPMSHTPPPRPEVGKLPSWYPREQAARAAASSPLARESRGPRVGQEAWGWRSSPHHGIPEETEEQSRTVTMPPWPYAGGVVTPGPDVPNDMVRGETLMTPPILPPRPVVHTPEPVLRSGGERKRTPKYRIEQDAHGHPVLVPEPGFDDSRWTVFEIGGVEFKRAPGAGDGGKGAQWVPKRLSGLRRPESNFRPQPEHQYSDSPAPMHAALEGRQYDA